VRKNALKIAFNESVDVFFFDQEDITSLREHQYQGRLKEFDGCSNLSTMTSCFDDYIACMSTPSEKSVSRGRERSYHWDPSELLLFSTDMHSSDSESTRSDDELWIMENMPCDCDLLET
jgi:hypothetical protein